MVYTAQLQRHFFQHKSHVVWRGLNLRRRGARPTNILLSHATGPSYPTAVLLFGLRRDYCLQFSVRFASTGAAPVFHLFMNTTIVHKVFLPRSTVCLVDPSYSYDQTVFALLKQTLLHQKLIHRTHVLGRTPFLNNNCFSST